MKLIPMILVLLSALAWAADKPSQYTINVHVSASRLVAAGGDSIEHRQRMEVLIDGKKYELESDRLAVELLALGDYKARIVKERRKQHASFVVYELLFPDQSTARYVLVGQME